jgi:uncharacterized protein (TIGR03435 family)
MNTTRRLGIGTLAFILMTQAGMTQTPLAFEVASVKRNPDTGGASSGVQIRPDRLEAIWIPAQGLIIQAFGVSGVRVIGMPDWARTERYDIRARTSKPSSRQEILTMLQTLLADRFSMKVHREMREMDIYALIVAKPGSLGPKLQRVVVDCETNALANGSGPGLFPRDARPPCGNMISNARFRPEGGPSLVQNRFAALTMERMASSLAGVGRPVVDRTGLTGTFDVELDYLSETVAPAVTTGKELSGPTLREALKEQLGLDLRPDRGPVEFLVIDSIARPTPD